MNLMVTVDKNWAIGRRGERLVSIPEEQKLLREETLGKVLVMSRKTLETFPGKQPLYGRTTLVLTRDLSYEQKGVTVCRGMEEALKALKDYPAEEVFVLGGQSIFEQFLPLCDTVHAIYVDYAYDADMHFPNLDAAPQWELCLESEEHTYFDICYTFRMYRRNLS